jgi:hypothetical protein
MVDVTSYATASTTAASNASIAGTSILGTGLVSTADDSFRNSMALAGKFYSDFGGTATVGGSANAITVTTPTVYTALSTGMRIRLIPGSANTSAVTLNLDSIGAKAVRKISGGTDVALVADDLIAASPVDMVYSAAANAAAGGWVIDRTLGNIYGYSNDAGAAAAPNVILKRDSASPAASDLLALLQWLGKDSAANDQEYGSIQGVITDATSASEDGGLDLYNVIAGARNLALPLSTGSGVGSWTPIDSSGAGLSLSSVTGTYLKIGRLVVAWFKYTMPSTASGVGATLGGLPFTITAGTTFASGLAQSNASSPYSMLAALAVNNTTTVIFTGTTAAGVAATNANLTTATVTGIVAYLATA